MPLLPKSLRTLSLPPLSRLRYAMPRVRHNGHGLANEIVPWARAFLASQVLDATLLPPAFGLNRRGYWRHFGTSPDDWIYHRAMQRILPVVDFGEADYLEHGGGDVVTALQSFAAARGLLGRRVYLFRTEGMWGGYRHIQAAREFIRSTLYQSRFAPGNLLRLRARLDLRKIVVGMHVRLGDFKAAQSLQDYRRAPNTSLPLQWFHNIAQSLQAAFGQDWQLLLVSDGDPEQLRALHDGFPCVISGDLPHGDCSDLLALAASDLLVCSASCFSSLAAFLAEGPYLWFAPNLHPHPEGCYSMHGDSSEISAQSAALRAAVGQFAKPATASSTRGFAVDADGQLPAAALEAAALRRDLRRWEQDLVRGGVTPIPAASESASSEPRARVADTPGLERLG